MLLDVAYRLLGSSTEAADAVQEGLARWYSLGATERTAIRSPRAWLITTVSRICLDELKSARARRDTYVGDWLPEPVPGTSTGRDPAERVTLDESVRMALLVVLETMTPAERVVFVLHDVFRYRFDEIGAIVGRTSEACRQLAVSARRRVASGERRASDVPLEHEVVASVMEAWRARDVHGLVRLFDDSVRMITDGGGAVVAARRPIVGARRVARALTAVLGRDPGLALEVADVNGAPGLIVRGADRAVTSVVTVAGRRDRVTDIWVVRNPAKLDPWTGY